MSILLECVDRARPRRYFTPLTNNNSTDGTALLCVFTVRAAASFLQRHTGKGSTAMRYYHIILIVTVRPADSRFRTRPKNSRPLYHYYYFRRYVIKYFIVTVREPVLYTGRFFCRSTLISSVSLVFDYLFEILKVIMIFTFLRKIGFYEFFF